MGKTENADEIREKHVGIRLQVNFLFPLSFQNMRGAFFYHYNSDIDCLAEV